MGMSTAQKQEESLDKKKKICSILKVSPKIFLGYFCSSLGRRFILFSPLSSWTSQKVQQAALHPTLFRSAWTVSPCTALTITSPWVSQNIMNQQSVFNALSLLLFALVLFASVCLCFIWLGEFAAALNTVIFFKKLFLLTLHHFLDLRINISIADQILCNPGSDFWEQILVIHLECFSSM